MIKILITNMASVARDSTLEQVHDNSQLSGDEINDQSVSDNESDQSDIDLEGLESTSESGSDSEEEDSEDEGIAWSQDFHNLTFEDFSGTPGIKVAVPNDPDEYFFFSLIFGDQILDLIVRETNRHARQKLVNKPALLEKWQDVTREELKAYFGISIIMGINSLPRIAMYWSTDSFIGNIGVQNVFTKNRFELISQYIHFSDSTHEPQRGDANYNRLYKIREILSSILKNIQAAYEPSKNLSVDEGMIAFKGRLSWPQTPKMAMSQISLFTSGEKVVLTGLASMLLQVWPVHFYINTDIFFDNFFTGTGLMDYLLAQNTYASGTVRVNRKDLPPCAKRKLKQGEMVRAQRGHLLFTKWHDKQDVSFLSTNISPNEPSRPVQRKKNGREITIQKLRVADLYTAQMGGVDRADQLRSFYFSGWQSRKWYRYIFWFLFNLSICNSFVLANVYRGRQRKRTMLEFRLKLAKQLINGFSQQKRKRRSLDGANFSNVAREEHISVKVEGRKRKCVQCIKAGRRTPKGYKVKTRFECKLCKVALCRTCHNEFHAQAE